jgi:murein L,D-transpeptidase YcbB/YkuD
MYKLLCAEEIDNATLLAAYIVVVKEAAANNPKRIPTDAKWGPATIEALKMFQRAEGIKDDGIAGPNTYDKLHSLGLDQDAIDSIMSGIGKMFKWVGRKIFN